MEKWGKSFWSLYIEIEKVQKSILLYIPLLGVFAILTKDMRLCILSKAGF